MVETSAAVLGLTTAVMGESSAAVTGWAGVFMACCMDFIDVLRLSQVDEALAEEAGLLVSSSYHKSFIPLCPYTA